MKEMVGGCCVCSDDRGWTENPLVYCDGAGCTVAVHQACYGIVTVPTGNWYCRKCESQERGNKVRCELCPNKEGALKPTDNNAWAHVVCALYIPEVRFGNVTTMEPIILAQIPQERFQKACYICEDRSRSRAIVGACMQCNKAGCKQQFHVTCAQGLGLLCEEASNYMENVKYCGYCHHHYTKLKKGGNVKVIPPYRPVGASNDSPEGSPIKETEPVKASSKRKLCPGSSKGGKVTEPGDGACDDDKTASAGLDGEGSKLANKKKKGGSRTSPASLTSPDCSPRPISPSGSNNVPKQIIPTPAIPTPTVTQQQAFSKESSRHSIVVTVPIEVLPANVSSIPTPSPPPPIAVAQPQVGSASTPVLIPDQQSIPPPKRQRSQSSEKGDSKGRRLMKRSVSGRPPTPPPPPQSQPSSGSKSSSPGESSNSQLLGTSEMRYRRTGPTSGVVVKEERDIKVFQNGLNAPHMLGNQLNPSSVMAQKMCDTLTQEMAAHSVFSQQETSQSSTLVGPQLHRPLNSQGRVGAWTGATQTNHNTTNNNIPQCLEQLLERQWEQGSQFLMEQAQHFDIASLLSCLHQLRSENSQLEDHVSSLVQRRDHLLAVNARLAIPLVQPPQHSQPQGRNVVTPPVIGAAPVVENGMASQAEQAQYQRNTPQPMPRSNSVGYPVQQPMQQHNSVVVRASSGDQRRSSSASGSYSNHVNPTSMYQPSQQQPHQQSQQQPHQQIQQQPHQQIQQQPHQQIQQQPHQQIQQQPHQQSLQQPHQQSSQVVMRRDILPDIHHNMSGNGGKLPQP